MARTDTNGVWTTALASRGFGIHNGNAYGVVTTEASGYLPVIPALPGFDQLPAEVQPLVAQAVAEFVQNRIAQVAANKSGASLDSINAAVADAMAGRAMPGKRDKDALAAAVEAEITKLALERKPDATDAQIKKTVADNGENYLAKHRERLLAEGRFAVPVKRKRDKDTIEAIAIE